MRVLFIDTEQTWRGGENQMALLIGGLQKRGIFCYLAAPKESEAYKRLHTSMPAMPLNFKGLGIISTAMNLAEFCEEADINLIDTQSSRAHNLGVLTKLFNPSPKLVVHRRVDYVPSRNIISRLKYLTPKVDQYVAISQAIAGVLTSYGIAEHRVSVVHSAVEPNSQGQLSKREAKERLCQELGLDAATPLLSCVAYLTPQKGHHTLLRALGRVKAHHLAFNCLLAGDGPLRAELQQLAASLNIQNEVHFLGVRNDVPLILKATDLFALSSDYEGLGTTILDALFADCPVVATRVGGIPEMIQHEKTGFLAEKGDDEAFAGHLMTALNHPGYASELARRGKEAARQKFNVDAMVEGNLKVYQSLFVNPV
jgi:glycosyltransferase involved in cell wall biosynthesis